MFLKIGHLVCATHLDVPYQLDVSGLVVDPIVLLQVRRGLKHPGALEPNARGRDAPREPPRGVLGLLCLPHGLGLLDGRAREVGVLAVVVEPRGLRGSPEDVIGRTIGLQAYIGNRLKKKGKEKKGGKKGGHRVDGCHTERVGCGIGPENAQEMAPKLSFC